MNAESRFNYLVGGIALLSAISSVVWFSHNFRPRILIKELDELLRETVQLYDSYVANGLLDDESLREGLKRGLLKLKRSASVVREDTYKITTTAGDYRALFRGESRKIRLVSTNIIGFRASMVRTSEKLRRDRQHRDARNPQNNPQENTATAEQIPRESSPLEVSSPRTTTLNATSSVPECTPALPLYHDLEVDSVSLTLTLADESSSPPRRFLSFLTSWPIFPAQGKVVPDDVERGAPEPVSTS